MIGGIFEKHSKEILPCREALNWRKKGIFIELPYWIMYLLRHSVDSMHVEKNVCAMLLETLLDIRGKAENTLNARNKLMQMNMQEIS